MLLSFQKQFSASKQNQIIKLEWLLTMDCLTNAKNQDIETWLPYTPETIAIPVQLPSLASLRQL